MVKAVPFFCVFISIISLDEVFEKMAFYIPGAY